MSTRPTTITTAELRELLAAQRGSRAFAFTALTRPEQKANPFGKIQKLVKINAMTGCIYEHAKLKAVGQEAGERAWGEHNDSALVTRRAKDGTEVAYVPVQINRVSRPLYLVPGQKGRLMAVHPNVVTPYLRQRPEPAVAYKDYRLDSIVTLAWGGRRYRVRQETTVT